MKKFAILFSFLSLFLVGCGNTNTNINNETNSAVTTENIISNTNGFNASRLSTNTPNAPEIKEEQISTFSTKISQDDASRQKNISLGCAELNGTIVKAGETFSFCNTLGPATPEKGYEKAETFDSDGNTIMDYGGGKCQISSTLYNAVLAVPTLTVVERYPHSKRVYYVEEGKDATVCYGSVDFKFRNNNDFDIKIVATGEQDTLTVSLFKI